MAIEFAEANSGTGGAKFAVDNITEGVNTLAVPYVKLMSGVDASNAVIPGDATNGLDVDVTRLPSTNLAAGNLVQLDYDTGAGTQNMPMVGVALPASGGAVAGGTATNPIRIDPTGTTTQPISGTVTANAGTGTFVVDSELPTAAALADAAANPTTPTVGAAALLFNGTTWDRARGDTTNGLDVDVTRVQGSVTIKADTLANQTSDLKITLDGEAVVLGTGTNTIGKVDQGAAAAVASGWPVKVTDGTNVLGTGTNPIRVDPTGTTAQPVTAVDLDIRNLSSSLDSITAINGGSGKTLKTAAVALTATGTVVAAVTGKRIKVYRYAIQSRNDTMTVRFRDGGAGSAIGMEWLLNTREGVSSGAVDPPNFLFATTAGNSLDAIVSGTGTVWVEVQYFDDDAT